MATFFGKALRGIGKGAKFLGQTALATATSQLGIVLPSREVTVTQPMGKWTPGIAGGDLSGGMLNEVVVSGSVDSSKPIMAKVMDLLDVASGNRPFQTEVGVSDSVIPKWVFPAGFAVAGLMLYKAYTKR